MSATTTTEHLTSFLSDPIFSELTGLAEGIGNHTRCELCKSTISNERSAPDVMFHMLFSVLKITHSLHMQMQKLAQQLPLNPPSPAPLNLLDPQIAPQSIEEVKGNAVEPSLGLESI